MLPRRWLHRLTLTKSSSPYGLRPTIRFIPPRNLNVPPPTVLANLPPSTAYVGREQQPQGYRAQEEPSQGEYEEAQVQAYHRPRVSMSTQKPRTNMQ